MTAPDMDVIKEIPGYKVILKAVLKAQIQQLVEQLAAHTEEDSIILTASVHDGTLSHLGTDSGKSFLDDHEDVKSQFLGFCLKYHHQKKQQKEKEEREEAMRKAAASANANMYGGQYMPIRSPRHQAPRYMGPRPVRSPMMRHHPYPVTRPIRAPTMPSLSPLKSANKIDGQTIKIELEDSNDENSNQGLTATTTNINVPENASGSASQSPSQNQPLTPSKSVKLETGNNDNDDDAQSESSNSNIPSEQTTETNLGLDSDLSTLISGANNDTQTETDPNVSVKLEALTESEMELEITGVEPGRPMPQPAQETWDPNVSMGMNFDPTGATGSQGDLSQQGYNPHFNIQTSADDAASFQQRLLSIVHSGNIENGALPRQSMNTNYTNNITNQSQSYHQHDKQAARSYPDHSSDILNIDPVPIKMSGGLSLYKCDVCGKCFNRKDFLKRHVIIHTALRPFVCDICGRGFNVKTNLNSHRAKMHLVNPNN